MTDHAPEIALTPAGQFVRDRCTQPDAERAENDPVRQGKYTPCCREHQPGRICVLPDGHQAYRPAENGDSQ